MLNQCDSLTNKPQISTFAKKGFYVLDQVRKKGEPATEEKPRNEPNHAQMTQMNNFLNLYAQKLSIARPEEDANPEKRI